jgi:hypothetical protein
VDNGFVLITQQTNTQDNKLHLGSHDGELERRHGPCQPGLSNDESEALGLKKPSKEGVEALDTWLV